MPRETSRRSLLAGLSAAPAVFMSAALPLPATAHPGPATTGADALVFAQAKRVGRFARCEFRAFCRAADLERQVEAGMPPRPKGDHVRQAADAAYKAELDAVGGVLAHRINDPIIVEAHDRGYQASKAILAPFDAACRAWDVELKRRYREAGAAAANARAGRYSRRLERAAQALGRMRPQTVAGCIAMARAAGDVAMGGNEGGWAARLHEGVVRSVAALQIGGRADA